jgi:2'-5' RNA ligase
VTPNRAPRSVIVALLPDDNYARLRPGAKNPHLTVAHLGTPDDPELNPRALRDLFKTITALWPIKLKSSVVAETAFDTPDGWAHVDLVNAPFLPDFRSIVQESIELHGMPLSRDYGLMPHITRRYVKGVPYLEIVHRKLSIDFYLNRLVIWSADDKLEQELT